METLNSLLLELFPKGYKASLLEIGNEIKIGLKSLHKTGICPDCNRRCSNIETEYPRVLREMDLIDHKCYIHFSQKKIRCKCGYRGVEALDFVSKSRRVTKRMETFVVSMCEAMSLKEVTKICRLGWKTIKNIDFSFIKSQLPKIKDLKIRRIAIDEIAIMKGHKYLTIIRDYDTGVVLKMTFGRTYEATSRALESLGNKILKKIEYVSMDMWDAYIRAVKEQCPNAKLVFDKFHVVKKINEAIDTVRKKEFKNAEPEERKKMKHKRFVILKREKRLNPEERDELETIMQNNDKLYKAYILKEQMLSIFEDTTSTFEQIQQRIKIWFENILSNQMEEFYDVLNTMQNYLGGILNYFRYGMTNAIAEGFNTKINVIKRRAFGFRDVEYFMLKIFQSSMKRLS